MNSKIIAFAINAHNNVNHLYDGNPYSVHLAMVAFYGQKYINYIPDEAQQDVIDACWLHDTIEDCRLTYNDLMIVTYNRVADIVIALTNNKGRTRKERADNDYYEMIRYTPLAPYVKLCDRLANAYYSKETQSKMFEVYRKENEHFLNSLFPVTKDQLQYKSMIDELNDILEIQSTPL